MYAVVADVAGAVDVVDDDFLDVLSVVVVVVVAVGLVQPDNIGTVETIFIANVSQALQRGENLVYIGQRRLIKGNGIGVSEPKI